MTDRRLVYRQSPNKPAPVLLVIMSDAMLGLVFREGHVVDSFEVRAGGSPLVSLSEGPSRHAPRGHCGSADVCPIGTVLINGFG